MPNTTNLSLPYPAAADNPQAAVLAALTKAVDDLAGPWVNYTVTLSQGSAVAFTPLYARYRVIGKMCEWNFALDLTALGTSAQPVLIGLPPITPKYTTSDIVRGELDFVAQTTRAQLVQPSGSTTQVRVVVLGGNYTTQLTSTDFLRGWGQYEVA